MLKAQGDIIDRKPIAARVRSSGRTTPIFSGSVNSTSRACCVNAVCNEALIADGTLEGPVSEYDTGDGSKSRPKKCETWGAKWVVLGLVEWVYHEYERGFLGIV